MSLATYVMHCLAIHEQLFGELVTPLDPKDHPELDDTEFLDNDGMHLYLKLLGMLQWVDTLRKIDIMCAVMKIGRLRCQPRIEDLNRSK